MVHLFLFGLLVCVGTNTASGETPRRVLPAQTGTYSAGDTSDLLLDCGCTVSMMESFVYLCSLLHYDMPDHHGVEGQLKKALHAFCAVRSKILSSRDILERLTGKFYAGGVLAVSLYGWESLCLAAAK